MKEIGELAELCELSVRSLRRARGSTFRDDRASLVPSMVTHASNCARTLMSDLPICELRSQLENTIGEFIDNNELQESPEVRRHPRDHDNRFLFESLMSRDSHQLLLRGDMNLMDSGPKVIIGPASVGLFLAGLIVEAHKKVSKAGQGVFELGTVVPYFDNIRDSHRYASPMEKKYCFIPPMDEGAAAYLIDDIPGRTLEMIRMTLETHYPHISIEIDEYMR